MKTEQEYKKLLKEIKERKRYMALPGDTFPGQTDFNRFKEATEQLENKAEDLLLDSISQKFCRTCHGLKELKMFGKVIQPKNWSKALPDMANDIGCWCNNPHLKGN